MKISNGHQFALEGLKCLQEAVRAELEKKAKLGQYAIVAGKDGKAVRVLASELIKGNTNVPTTH